MSTNLPDSILIKAYLEGKLDHDRMYRLEKQALDDPFLWEAMEGYAQNPNSGTGLSILQRQLHERIVHLQENKKVFDFTWQRLSVAASASVLFITAGILFWMNIYRPGSIAEKQVHVSLIDRDSLKTEIHGSQNRPVIKEKEYPNSSQETKIQSAKPFLEEQGTESKAPVSSAYIGAPELGVQPVLGWEIYRKYLEDNIRIPANEPKVNGSVLLYFEFNENGNPTNIQIIKGLTAACNIEAIRLIKNGPNWKIANGSKINSGRIEVRF